MAPTRSSNSLGLVNRVLPAAALEKFVLDYAAMIAGNAPLTIAAVKRSLIEMPKDPGERDLALCNNRETQAGVSGALAACRTLNP